VEIDGVAGLEQLMESWRLRDVESEELIVVEMARDHGVHAAPTAAERDGAEDQPSVGFREVRNGVEKANGYERARSGADFRDYADPLTAGERTHVVCKLSSAD
jgi:hypothetical protein